MLVRWTPAADLSRISREFDRLFDLGQLGQGWNGAIRADAVEEYTPAVDVIEDAERYMVLMDLPGVAQSELDLSVEGQVLTVKGERKLDRPGAHAELQRRFERRAGTFARSFKLPPQVDAEKISASMKDGVLALALPKRTESLPRQIKINVQA